MLISSLIDHFLKLLFSDMNVPRQVSGKHALHDHDYDIRPLDLRMLIEDEEDNLAELVAKEISAMDVAIEEAAKKIEKLLEASRQKDTGTKLEVNVVVLDSCTELVRAIKELVNKSKALQKEIISLRDIARTFKFRF